MDWKLLFWAGGILLLLMLGYQVIKVGRRGVRRLRGMMEAIQAGAQAEQMRPKSLSSMERLLLPTVRKDFPEYDARMMARRAEQDALYYYHSLQKKQVLFGETQGVFSFLRMMEQVVLQNEEKVGQPCVHRAVLCAYSGDGAQRFVVYQAACQYRNELGETVQTKLELTYIAAEKADAEQNICTYQCPNCGAPIGNIGQKICEYCGTVLYPAAPLSWMLFKISESK
jgi:hypothetical protein